MASVRPALPNDFDGVRPLLDLFNNSRMKDEDWQRLFQDHWNAGNGQVGYVLVDNSQIVGYLGLIFCFRKIDGVDHRFCNLTSWVTQEAYRNQSLLLQLPVLQIKDTTLTVFSASLETFSTYEKLGYQLLDEYIRLLVPSTPTISGHRYSITTDPALISKNLDRASLKIFDDHKNFPCIHMLVESAGQYSYLVIIQKFYKRLPYGQIIYLSHPRWFQLQSKNIVLRICRILGVLLLAVDERFWATDLPMSGFRRRLKVPRLFKSKTVPRERIDLMYSEVPLLKV
jgi:hypothetical protein